MEPNHRITGICTNGMRLAVEGSINIGRDQQLLLVAMSVSMHEILLPVGKQIPYKKLQLPLVHTVIFWPFIHLKASTKVYIHTARLPTLKRTELLL